MKKSIRTQLIKALRSGKYQQTTDFLREGSSRFCVIGLLCELYRETTGRGQWVGPFKGPFNLGIADDSKAYCFYAGGTYSTELPGYQVARWASVLPGEAMHLYQLNDVKRLSFTEIAEQLGS